MDAKRIIPLSVNDTHELVNRNQSLPDEGKDKTEVPQNERLFIMMSILEFQEIAVSGTTTGQFDDDVYSWSALSVALC
jgi:hypothetical protein